MTCFGINYAIQTYFVNDLNKSKDEMHEIAKTAIKHFSDKEAKYFVVANNKIVK
jgi:hypothetical protein